MLYYIKINVVEFIIEIKYILTLLKMTSVICIIDYIVHIVICSKSLTATAKSLQSCPTLCDPIDGSPPGFPVPGILQARTLEWVAISFSNA